MVATAASDVLVAAITGIATIVAAALATYAVVYSVRAQKQPRIVEMSPDEKDRTLAAEREGRIRAEARLELLEQIALIDPTRIPDS